METTISDMFSEQNIALFVKSKDNNDDSSAYSSENLSSSSLSSFSSCSSSYAKSPSKLEKTVSPIIQAQQRAVVNSSDGSDIGGSFYIDSQRQQQQLEDAQQLQVSQQVLQQLGFNIYDDNIIDINYNHHDHSDKLSSISSCSNKLNDTNMYIDDDFILNYLNTSTELSENTSSPSSSASLFSPASSLILPPSHVIDTSHNTSSPLLATILSPDSDALASQLSLGPSDGVLCNVPSTSVSSSCIDISDNSNGICFKFEYMFENEKLIQVQPPLSQSTIYQMVTTTDSMNDNVIKEISPSSSSVSYEITPTTPQQHASTR